MNTLEEHANERAGSAACNSLGLGYNGLVWVEDACVCFPLSLCILEMCAFELSLLLFLKLFEVLQCHFIFLPKIWCNKINFNFVSAKIKRLNRVYSAEMA